MSRSIPSQCLAQYLRQFPINEPSTHQLKKVRLVPSEEFLSWLRQEPWQGGRYAWRLAREFEGHDENDEQGGCWPVNYWRMARTFGELPYSYNSRDTKLSQLSQEDREAARCARTLLYHRATNSSEIIKCIDHSLDIRVAMEVGTEWYDPPDGKIEFQTEEWSSLSTHSVPFTSFDYGSQRFSFRNSWGAAWGGRGEFSPPRQFGYGSVPRELVDARVVEAWHGFGIGLDLPINGTMGLSEIEWKWQASPQIQIHIREIRDGNERVAWAFCVPREKRLDVEEFYVVPQYRNRGLAKTLANSVQRLAKVLKRDIRLLISFGDVEANDSAGPNVVARLFGFTIRDGDTRYVHNIADLRTGPTPKSVWDRLPTKPATVLELLRPNDEEIVTTPKIFHVLFGTNRAIRYSPGRAHFRDVRGKKLRTGVAEVNVPRTHKFGSTGRSFLRRWTTGVDDRLKVVGLNVLNSEEFSNRAFSFRFDEDDSAKHLLFIHGYNVDFIEACARAAQLGFDLKVDGHTFLYSWPSAGRLPRYWHDEATVEAALPFFCQFMDRLAHQLGSDKIDIIAHSMGNRLLVRWLEMQHDNPPNVAGVVFAAPDVDCEVFATGLTSLRQRSSGATVYASSGDIPVFFSRLVHKYDRAGLSPPVTVVPAADTVEVRGLDLFSIGHSYFGNKAALLHDKFMFFRYGFTAEKRQRLVETRTQSGQTYWILEL